MKNLLKIMFVDDEVNVLRGMRNSYDWDALGFTIVGEAGSAASPFLLPDRTSPMWSSRISVWTERTASL